MHAITAVVERGWRHRAAGADYTETVHAKTGDLGSKVPRRAQNPHLPARLSLQGAVVTLAHGVLILRPQLPPLPTGTVWAAGAAVEVAWNQKAWHGGGYSYRLCPAERALDEACFQETPLRVPARRGPEVPFHPRHI
jgi:hypothetical protein